MDREELKRARRAGRWQGALIMAGIAVFIALLFLTIGLARKIRNGTILSLLNFGGTSESVITSEVTDKADTLKAVIDTYYYEDVDEEALKNGIYKGLMEGLGDPYSTYYTEEEKLRHTVRPGMSGWAQVNGRNNLSWDEKLALDVYYVKHLTLWMDIRVIAKTIVNVIKHKDVNVVPGLRLGKLSDVRKKQMI